MKKRITYYLKSIIFLLFTFCFLHFTAFGAFKDSGWGARPAGMGGAFTAISDDANGQLYNPAGIAQIASIESTFMHAKLFTGLDDVDLGLNYASSVMPIGDNYTTGVLWGYFNSENQYLENTFVLTFAGYVTDKISLGINVKHLSHKYILDEPAKTDIVFSGGDSKSAFSSDLGILYLAEEKVDESDLFLGAAIKNINQPDVGLKTKDTVPMEIRGGIAYLSYYNEAYIYTLATDISYRMQDWGGDADKINYHIGGEIWFYREIFALRAGRNSSEITTGLSYRPEIGKMDIQFDYSFLWPFQIRETTGSHRLALTVRFIPAGKK